MSSQAEGAVADVAAETLAVEEEAFGAQSLHHVHSLGAEVADVAAAESGGEVLTYHRLRWRRSGRGYTLFSFVFFKVVVFFCETPASTQNMLVPWSSSEMVVNC